MIAPREIAGFSLIKKYIPGPQGVRSRNSDNTRLREVLGWEPRVSLEEGLRRTYQWIEQQIIAADKRRGKLPGSTARHLTESNSASSLDIC